MKWLIISDIHSNLDALDIVLARAKKFHYDRMACLGDLVGYGPNPNEIVEWAKGETKSGSIFVRGNHDDVIGDKTKDTTWYNPAAELAIKLQRKMLTDDNAKFLTDLPLSALENDIQFIHGSPGGWDEYITYSSEAEYGISCMKGYMCFIGHTHSPAVWKDDDLRPKIINVGSVGQPRDDNPKACFVIFDSVTKEFKFHRAQHDVAAVQKKMSAIEGMPPSLIERLKEGR